MGFFCQKNPSTSLRRTPTFWTFWEFLHFHWPCSATFLLSAIFKKSKNFFEKPTYVFSKKPNFQTFWDIFLIQLQSASKWLLLVVSKKTQDIFWTTNFFSRRNHFLNVLRSLTNSVASYNKVLSLAISTKSIFFRKTLIFYFL